MLCWQGAKSICYGQSELHSGELEVQGRKGRKTCTSCCCAEFSINSRNQQIRSKTHRRTHTPGTRRRGNPEETGNLATRKGRLDAPGCERQGACSAQVNGSADSRRGFERIGVRGREIRRTRDDELREVEERFESGESFTNSQGEQCREQFEELWRGRSHSVQGVIRVIRSSLEETRKVITWYCALRRPWTAEHAGFSLTRFGMTKGQHATAKAQAVMDMDEQ